MGDHKAWIKANDLAEEAEVRTLVSRINLEALCARSSLLRSGVACSIAPIGFTFKERRSVMGGRHYHILVSFADGVEWIARIPRQNAATPPACQRDLVLISEVATLQFLGSTKVPVPTVYDFSVEGSHNPVGVTYLLMDRVKGHVLNLRAASLEQQVRLLEQLADMFIELERHPFPAIGSLCNSGTLVVSGRTEDDTADLDEHGNTIPFGPFSENSSYLASKINFFLRLIRRREMYAQSPVDAYLVHRHITDTFIPTLNHSSEPSFFLTHMDDKGDHILVDDDFNITAIIDWEWAQTTSKAEAFCAPLGLLDVGAFYSGDNALSPHEKTFAEIFEKKGRPDMSSMVRNGRIQHRIALSIGGDVEDPEFRHLFEGFLRLQTNGGEKPPTWGEWREETLRKYAADEELIKLIEEENS